MRESHTIELIKALVDTKKGALVRAPTRMARVSLPFFSLSYFSALFIVFYYQPMDASRCELIRTKNELTLLTEVEI